MQKPFEADDPFQLCGRKVASESFPQATFNGVVEEYARMGVEPEKLLRMFQNPFYQGLHTFWLEEGPEKIREKVFRIYEKIGVWRVRMEETTAKKGGL